MTREARDSRDELESSLVGDADAYKWNVVRTPTSFLVRDASRFPRVPGRPGTLSRRVPARAPPLRRGHVPSREKREESLLVPQVSVRSDRMCCLDPTTSSGTNICVAISASAS